MIYVKFQKEGVHRYPNAPDDVAFLRNEHRHMFHFKVWIEVFHNDRDIEFIRFKRELEGLYNQGILKLDYKSCEMMAEELYTFISTNYQRRDIVIDVSEDGENGAVLQFKRDPDEGR